MNVSQGRRIEDDSPFQPGDYGKVRGVWHARPPVGAVGSLEAHEVEEHEDRTITVHPSIDCPADDRGLGAWHGHLRAGVWEEVS